MLQMSLLLSHVLQSMPLHKPVNQEAVTVKLVMLCVRPTLFLKKSLFL